MDCIEIIEVADGSNMAWNNIEIKNNTEYGYTMKIFSNTRVDLVVHSENKIKPTFVLNIHRNVREIIIEKHWNIHPKRIEFGKEFRTIISLGKSSAHIDKASIIYENI